MDWRTLGEAYTAGPVIRYVMLRARSVNIDAEYDFRRSARMLAERQ